MQMGFNKGKKKQMISCFNIKNMFLTVRYFSHNKRLMAIETQPSIVPVMHGVIATLAPNYTDRFQLCYYMLLQLKNRRYRQLLALMGLNDIQNIAVFITQMMFSWTLAMQIPQNDHDAFYQIQFPYFIYKKETKPFRSIRLVSKQN